MNEETNNFLLIWNILHMIYVKELLIQQWIIRKHHPIESY